MGRFRARCKLGFDLNTQVHHGSDEPGIVGAAIYREIFIDQRSLRSHPNKAVDVVLAKLQVKVLDPGAINSYLSALNLLQANHWNVAGFLYRTHWLPSLAVARIRLIVKNRIAATDPHIRLKPTQ